MEPRHEIVSGAEHLVTTKCFFCLKVSKATKANLVLVAMLCNVRKKSRDVGDWSIVSFPVEQLCHALIVFATYNKGMASTAFIIKKGKHIDVDLELVFVKVYICGCDRIGNIDQAVTLEYFF